MFLNYDSALTKGMKIEDKAEAMFTNIISLLSTLSAFSGLVFKYCN